MKTRPRRDPAKPIEVEACVQIIRRAVIVEDRIQNTVMTDTARRWHETELRCLEFVLSELQRLAPDVYTPAVVAAEEWMETHSPLGTSRSSST